MHVLGRDGTARGTDGSLPTVRLGSFLARDGSVGAAVGVDVDGPHAGVVFGKRGTGKSYTLGVLAEGLADARGVSPIVVDPMGVFTGLESTGARVVEPTVRPDSIPPSAWPDLLGLDSTGGPGGLLWRVVADATDGTYYTDHVSDPPSITDLRDRIEDTDARIDTRRAAVNHLRLADSWGIFNPDAPPISAFAADGSPTVVDLAGVSESAAAAVVRAVARELYEARIDGDLARLPWLLVDEAHAFFGGVADPALRTLLT